MKITLLGKPISKMRARYSSRSGYVITYDPQQEAKESVKHRFTQALRDALDSDNKENVMDASAITQATAYKVDWLFYLPLPISDSIQKRNAKLWGFELPTCKPDYDNLEKFYLDCANGILWPDDRMIIQASAKKLYAEEPRMEVIIEPIDKLNLSEKSSKIVKSLSPKELHDFLIDIWSLTELHPSDIDLLEGKEKTEWLHLASHLISAFATKYAKLLSKIEKIGEINFIQ